MFIVYRRPFRDAEPLHDYDMYHGEAHGPFETRTEAVTYANALPHWKIVTFGGKNESCIMEDPYGNTREFDKLPDLQELKWLGDYEIKELQKI
jgi:hypothetical protein